MQCRMGSVLFRNAVRLRNFLLEDCVVRCTWPNSSEFSQNILRCSFSLSTSPIHNKVPSPYLAVNRVLIQTCCLLRNGVICSDRVRSFSLVLCEYSVLLLPLSRLRVRMVQQIELCCIFDFVYSYWGRRRLIMQ